jgi:protoporphyrinogen oxidase
MKKRIAVIGAGISGLSAAHFNRQWADVVVYETGPRPGGLVQCDIVDGFLYHKVGGHVFNSKIDDVLDWFWAFFDREKEFHQARRNAVIAFDQNTFVGYPIENHLWQLPGADLNSVVQELLDLHRNPPPEPANFDEFLRNSFGETLYRIYFRPYNRKIWKSDLKDVPLDWLQGKLPMPAIRDIILNNILQQAESEMVHSTFYYPKEGGSQFIADRLAEGLNIRTSTPVERISMSGPRLCVNEQEVFDAIVYTGNLKRLPDLLASSFACEGLRDSVSQLASHGTTTVLCEIEPNPYSWVYLPGPGYRSHRIICTGNFSPSNNRPGMTSATVEFTDTVEFHEIEETLMELPFRPRYITHHHQEYTYPIQLSDTRSTIAAIENKLRESRIYLSGRFAEWEYYNMDTAIDAARRKVGKMLRDMSVGDVDHVADG